MLLLLKQHIRSTSGMSGTSKTINLVAWPPSNEHSCSCWWVARQMKWCRCIGGLIINALGNLHIQIHHRSVYQLNHAIIKHITALYDNKKHWKCWTIHYSKPPHAHSPGVASGTVACRLHIDVYDANDNDDNVNAWQRGPLWPHGMGPIILIITDNLLRSYWANKLIILRDRDDSKYIIIKQHFCEMWIIKLRQKSTYMLIRTRHIVSKTRPNRCKVVISFTITTVLSYGSVP